MTTGYIDLPEFGAAAWREPVASASDLPAVGNVQGDVRQALDTLTIYTWDGVSSWIAVATPGAAIALDGLIGDVTATGPGVATATIQSNVVSNSKLAQMPASTLKGNDTGLTANASDLSVASVKALLAYTTSDIPEGTNLYFTDARAQAAMTGAISTVTTSNLTASRILVSDASGKIAAGTVPSANLSGTNTGDVTLAAIGSSPNANAASLSGQTLTLQPASGSFGGVLTAGAQTIAGAKTFSGAISASNLSGTNTGDITLTAVGASPSAKGATLSGQALTLQPADSTHPGVMTAAVYNSITTKLSQSLTANKLFIGSGSNIAVATGFSAASDISAASFDGTNTDFTVAKLDGHTYLDNGYTASTVVGRAASGWIYVGAGIQGNVAQSPQLYNFSSWYNKNDQLFADADGFFLHDSAGQKSVDTDNRRLYIATSAPSFYWDYFADATGGIGIPWKVVYYGGQKTASNGVPALPTNARKYGSFSSDFNIDLSDIFVAGDDATYIIALYLNIDSSDGSNCDATFYWKDNTGGCDGKLFFKANTTGKYVVREQPNGSNPFYFHGVGGYCLDQVVVSFGGGSVVGRYYCEVLSISGMI